MQKLENRLVAYLSSDMLKWVREEAVRLGMSESMLVRFALLKLKNSNKK